MNGLLDNIKKFFSGNRRLLPAFAAIAVLSAILLARWGQAYHGQALEEIETLREKEGLYVSMASRAGEMSGVINDAEKKIGEMENRLIKAESHALGAAVLQETVKSFARKRGIAMTSERPLPVEKAGEYTRVPVEFQFRADLGQLKGLVNDIESYEGVLGIRALRARVPEQGPASRLDVTAVVEGAMKQ